MPTRNQSLGDGGLLFLASMSNPACWCKCVAILRAFHHLIIVKLFWSTQPGRMGPSRLLLIARRLFPSPSLPWVSDMWSSRDPAPGPPACELP